MTWLLEVLLFSVICLIQGEELHSSSTSPPRDMIVEKGSEVLLNCKSSIQVEECQWSWKDLFDDDKVDVKSFHSFGDDHHDCSVRFNNILSDQQGVWSCAVRSKNDTNFVIITEVRLAVLPSHLVQFMEEPSDTEVIVGNTCTLTCKTMDPTSNCQWTWRPSGAPQEKEMVIQEIFPNGLSNDCSLHLDNVSEEQDGLWTCGARAKPYQNYTITHTVKLTVVNAPLEFIELPGNSKVTVDTSKTLKCILSTSVEECRWQWKSEDTNNSNLVLVEQFTPMDKLKRDCSITIDKIKIEQEGYWICGARRRGDVKFIDSLLSHLTIYTGIEFVQLSQNIQKAIGEPVQMHCRINKAVEECQWTWQPINETIKTPEVKRRFQPAGDERRDCSIRLKMLLQEEEGIWTCGVRLHKNSSLTEASPTTVTLFPPIKLRFMEQPENIRVALGKPALLRCVATAAVEECRWTWRPLTEPDKEGVLVKQFLPFGSHNRNCSVRFRSVQQNQEGLWGCTAIGHPNSSLQSTPLAKLEVYQPVEIKFIENSKDIHIAAGGHIKLHCTTSSYVDMCRWTWEPIHPSSINVTPTIKQEFPATGKDGRNCSYRLEKVETEDEGIWVCSVRGQGMEEFVQAPPTKLLLVKSESVMVSLWSMPEQMVVLACRLTNTHPKSDCQWKSPNQLLIATTNLTNRFTVNYNISSGICTITFIPVKVDLGEWSCIFNAEDSSGGWELASASLFLLSTPTDYKIGWLVGALAASVFVLTLLLITVAVCRCRNQARPEKCNLGNPRLAGSSFSKDPSRYTDPPSKIDFQFREVPGRAATTETLSGQHQHIYERVDRYLAPTTCKSIYENVD